MATYKVIQDIEAEDKLLGPLTLRQFIYAGICVLCLYLCFLSITKHFAFMIAVFAPVAIFTGFFAFPWKLNQPTEVWALAKIRFMLKPRRRIWDQSGTKNLVNITAPKKVETNYTNGLSQTEVTSRLKALADTIDSRGWAVKNINVNLDSGSTVAYDQSPDRLVTANSLPQDVPTVDVQASDDMLDEQSSPVAQQFERMIQDSTQNHRQQIVQNLQSKPTTKLTKKTSEISRSGTPPTPTQEDAQKWFTHKAYASQATPTIDYGPSPEELPMEDKVPAAKEHSLSVKLKEQRHKADIAYNHLHRLNPASSKIVSRLRRRRPGFHKKATPVTQQTDPAILKLASNNDLNVATLERQANQKAPETFSDETVISLH